MRKPIKRDPGLAAAIAGAGGVAKLARLLGLSQPTVSIWKRVPPHRVIEIEKQIGVSRRVLRPDLYDVPEPVFFSPAPSHLPFTERQIALQS